MKQEILDRLTALRALMAEEGISAVIIPQTDPHQSEYLAAHWQVRRFFSSFTGSAGDLIVTADKALLWTDSRYFIQGAEQLDGTGITLMKDGIDGTPSQIEWLKSNLTEGDTVGVDPKVYSITAYNELGRQLAQNGIIIADFDPARVWHERPELPKHPIFIHEVKYAGVDTRTKIDETLTAVAEAGAEGVFISALDEIAWILNIRSRDVRYNPLATSFLYLSHKTSVIFVDTDKVSEDVARHFADNGVGVLPYNDAASFLAALPDDIKVLVEAGRNAKFVDTALGTRALYGQSLVAIPKAVKNDTQIAGIRAAMERDGVALVKAFMEIERRLAVGEQTSELDIAEILHHFRSEQPLYFDESFGTIAGYGPHGAIVHYEATDDTSAVIRTGNLLLVDSGAQYLDGTTDITRTVSIGEPTPEQRRDFTLVMKGHIALAQMQFPAGTTGHQLDAIARMFLWKNSLSYLHGTGHGVGQFLGVHEGPQSIRLNYVPTPLMPGMVTSNEPGLYRENIHGIRCENLVLTVPSVKNEFGQFLRFETLTLFPFDTSLFDTSLMSDDEIEWVNHYHSTVRARLTPLLNSAERTWLELKTSNLAK